MLLLEWTMNGTTYQFGDDFWNLESPWEGYVIGFNVNYVMAHDYGGCIAPRASQVTFNLKAFESDWPPPLTATFVAYFTTTTEAAKEKIVEGNAFFYNYDRNSITYKICLQTMDAEIADTTNFNDKLGDVFEEIVEGSAYLGLTADTTNMRAIPPDVFYTEDGDVMAVDFLSDMAAWFGHCMYRREDTIYLLDMTANLVPTIYDEFDFTPESSYDIPTQYSYLKCTNQGDASLVTDFPFAESELDIEAFDNNAADNAISLAIIAAILKKKRMKFICPLSSWSGSLPTPATRLQVYDASCIETTVTMFYARNMTLDFGSNKLILQGEGTQATL